MEKVFWRQSLALIVAMYINKENNISSNQLGSSNIGQMNSWFCKKKKNKIDGSLSADVDTYSKGKFLKFSEKIGWRYYAHC